MQVNSSLFGMEMKLLMMREAWDNQQSQDCHKSEVCLKACLSVSKSNSLDFSRTGFFLCKTKVLNISSKCCWKIEWGCAFDISKDDTYYISSVQFSHSVVSYSLWPHGLQLARPPCPSPTPRVHPNSCPLSQWCHPAISSSVVPFSSCP